MPTPAGTLQHRLVIPGVGSAFVPGDPDPLPDTDFWVSSRRNRAYHPWIADDGQGRPDIAADGQRIDVLTGRVEDGEVQIRVIDVPAPVTAVACDINSVLVAEGEPDLHLDATAFSSGTWTVNADCPLTSRPAIDWTANAAGPLLGTFALFGWTDPGAWVRSTWIEATFNGSEGGGTPWTPGQKVGFRFRVNWTLDTGGGNVFVEVNGTRVSGASGSFDFWSIPVDPLNNQVDFVVFAVVDGSGEVAVKLGAENMYPSFNLTVQFEDMEIVECDDIIAESDTERYVTGWLADVDARQQLNGRKAYLEESIDGGATWSRMLYSGYVQSVVLEESLTYLFTLGDTRRVERVTPPWTDIDPMGALIHQKPTALIGGPIYQGWNPLVKDYGLPVFRITDQAAATLGDNGWVALQYQTGPLPPLWIERGGAVVRNILQVAARQTINERAAPFHDVDGALSYEDAGSFPGLRATLLDVAAETATVEDLTPLANLDPFSVFPFFDPARFRARLVTDKLALRLRWSVTSTATYPTGTDFKLLITPRAVSEEWPLHLAMHPVSLTAALFDLIGEAWDVTTFAAVKTLVGDHVVDVLRLADPEQTIQDLNDQLFGRHQYGARRNAIGEWEFFYYGKVDATPSADLSLAVLRAEGGPTFDLGSSPRTNRVVIRSKLFVEWQEADGGEPAPDNLVVRDAPATFDLSPDGLVLDSAIYGREEQAYDLPGYVGFYTDLSPLGLGQYGAHLAERVFDRHGRGAVQNTFTCLRDSVADSALLGDAVIISPSHLPNAQLGQLPTSQRGGSRWARVIQRTEGMAGPVLQVVDDSTGVAYAETPTVTVSPSETADPEFFYDALIAGITQCQADGARVEVQFALGSAVPSAGNPYTILNAALFVDDASAVVDPWTETLGPFVRGQTVWFRVRAYRYSGAPGSWSAWASIGGVITGPLTTLSDLVISGETDEGADLDWSYDESPPVGEVLVQYRDISGLVGPYLDYGSPLAAGTETLTMTGLNTGTKYQVRLTLIDGSSAEYGDQLGGIFTTTGGKISNLSVTSITSTGAKLLWTNTDGVQFVLVEYRVTGAASYRVYALLPATSTRVRLAGLQPVTDYDVRVSLGKTGGNGAGGPADVAE